jgi:DMSO reductase family type II enzyme heme b subunit
MRTTFPSTLSEMPVAAGAVAAALCVVLLVTSASSAENAAAPTENPLRTADEATQQQARTEAWETFQRSCSPCHGSLGAGDGPYANAAPRTAADLRRPSREIVADAVRFKRIRDGAAALPERPWESNMPAFGGTLDDRRIWGLVLLLEDLGKRGTGLSPYATGDVIFAARCAVCHGARGAGDGPLASELLPAPTDLAHGPYRFRSTAYGAAPIENDIMISTASGLSHTAMGSFKSLGGNMLEDLKEHEKVLAAAYLATAPEPLPMSPLPARPIPEMVASGRAVYAKAGCADCHGASGRGNGAKGVALKDDKGRPSIPTDLTKRWHYKRGGGAPEIFQSITTGLSGTPMVSYADSLSADERWEIAYYLERSTRNPPRFSPTVIASTGVKEIPNDPASDFWDTVPTATVPLGPQLEQAPYWTQPSIDSVDVKVAARGDEFGVLLAWNDRTRNVRSDDAGKVTSVTAALQRYGEWQMPDQIALQYPEKLDPKGSLPAPYAGDATRTLRRWTWSAFRSESGDTQAVIERVGGPSAAPEAVADAPPVATRAAYVDGQWRVVFKGKRPFKAPALPLALHAWDGGAGESGTWRSFSSWVRVDLK